MRRPWSTCLIVDVFIRTGIIILSTHIFKLMKINLQVILEGILDTLGKILSWQLHGFTLSVAHTTWVTGEATLLVFESGYIRLSRINTGDNRLHDHLW